MLVAVPHIITTPPRRALIVDEKDKRDIEKHQAVVITRPKRCDFCLMRQRAVDAKYDAKTTEGPWANMCELHFIMHGIMLGTGYGQRLIVKEAE